MLGFMPGKRLAGQQASQTQNASQDNQPCGVEPEKPAQNEGDKSQKQG